MYKYHLLYDVKFTINDRESGTENEIPLTEIKALIPDISRNISNYFNFDFHTGLIGHDFENIAWAFPYVDVFDGKAYFVVEMGIYMPICPSVDKVTRLSESFCHCDSWEQHFSVEYRGLPIYVNIDWESRNELSSAYIKSVHYKLYDFMNSFANPMTSDICQLTREYFYKLIEKYPEIEVLQSIYIYESVRRDCRYKTHELFNAANRKQYDDSLANYGEQVFCLETLAQAYGIYKNLKQWSSKEQFDSIKYCVKKIAETTAADESTTIIQRFEDVQKAVFVLGEQLQDFMRKTSLVLNLPDKIKDCLNEFLYV